MQQRRKNENHQRLIPSSKPYLVGCGKGRIEIHWAEKRMKEEKVRDAKDL